MMRTQPLRAVVIAVVLVALALGASAAHPCPWASEIQGGPSRFKGLRGVTVSLGGVGLVMVGGEEDGVLTNVVFRKPDGSDGPVAEVNPTGLPPVAYHALVTINNDILLIGGKVDGGLSDATYKSSDGGATWNRVDIGGSSSITPRRDHGAACIGTTCWVFAGFGSGGQELGDGYVTSDEGLTWTQVTATPSWTPRGGASLTTLNSKLYLIGGHMPSISADRLDNTMHVFTPDPAGDGTTGTWESHIASHTGFAYHAAAEINGKIFTFGGRANTVSGVVTTAHVRSVASDSTMIFHSPGCSDGPAFLRENGALIPLHLDNGGYMMYVIGGSRTPTGNGQPKNILIKGEVGCFFDGQWCNCDSSSSNYCDMAPSGSYGCACGTCGVVAGPPPATCDDLGSYVRALMGSGAPGSGVPPSGSGSGSGGLGKPPGDEEEDDEDEGFELEGAAVVALVVAAMAVCGACIFGVVYWYTRHFLRTNQPTVTVVPPAGYELAKLAGAVPGSGASAAGSGASAAGSGGYSASYGQSQDLGPTLSGRPPRPNASFGTSLQAGAGNPMASSGIPPAMSAYRSGGGHSYASGPTVGVGVSALPSIPASAFLSAGGLGATPAAGATIESLPKSSTAKSHAYVQHVQPPNVSLTPPTSVNSSAGGESLVPMLSGESWTIHPSQLTIQERVGGGSFGVVWRGTYEGSEVAIKQLFAGTSEPDELSRVRDEATLLSQLHHPNVLHFYGVCARETDVFLVTEFCPRSVLDYLRDPEADHSLPAILRLALQVARAMRYLHGKGVIHRDLKPENLLLTATGDVRVCDFGLARVVAQTSMTVNTGTPAYMAPETMVVGTDEDGTHKRYSDKVDVYGFGVVLWTMITRRQPYGHIGNPFAIPAQVVAGARPRVPSTVPPRVSALIQACWAASPADRPSFNDVQTALMQPDIMEGGETGMHIRRHSDVATMSSPMAAVPARGAATETPVVRTSPSGDGDAKGGDAEPVPAMASDTVYSPLHSGVDGVGLLAATAGDETGAGAGAGEVSADGAAPTAENPGDGAAEVAIDVGDVVLETEDGIAPATAGSATESA